MTLSVSVMDTQSPFRVRERRLFGWRDWATSASLMAVGLALSLAGLGVVALVVFAFGLLSALSYLGHYALAAVLVRRAAKSCPGYVATLDLDSKDAESLGFEVTRPLHARGRQPALVALGHDGEATTLRWVHYRASGRVEADSRLDLWRAEPGKPPTATLSVKDCSVSSRVWNIANRHSA